MPDLGLPVINISYLLSAHSTLQQRQQTGTELHQTLKRYGFVYITGYGETINILKTAQDFFKLSNDEKMKYSISLNDNARGYQKLGQNTTSYQSDYHEGVDLYAEVILCMGLLPWQRDLRLDA
jgi:isopenicillin N synthase-like dioxygenase